MYLILFFASLSVAFARRKAKRGFGNKFLATALLLFVLITWHLAIDSAMLFLAYSNETTAEADLYYINGTPGTLNVMKTALYVATTLVSDAFMLYRCFVVWNYSIPIIVFPTLCLLAGIGTGITGLIGLSHTTTSFFIKDQLNVVSAFFGMTMATNGIATALIALRVWRGQRQISGIATGSSLSNLLIIILESGAIYSAMLILVLVLFVSKNTPGYNVVVDAVSSISRAWNNSEWRYTDFLHYRNCVLPHHCTHRPKLEYQIRWASGRQPFHPSSHKPHNGRKKTSDGSCL
ncbi:hypothetical protein B0H14DRAFT_2809898 [Mycena olivaceomarginata]|nr:hypothetical protein B0H14DRAFT_2809898 [Mycena olivaceomarginata]